MTSGKPNRCSWLIPAVILILLTLALGMPNSPLTRNNPESNESCGINMECVPRILCQEDIIQDDGIILITSGQAKCSNPLHRCCEVKQKEDNSQTSSQESP